MNNQKPQGMSLKDVVFNYPAIDNHAHPLLKEEHRRSLPFEEVISEAQPNAVKDVVHSLPGYRAARQLAELYGLGPDADWEEVKAHRDAREYDQLCEMNMQRSGIQCLLLDDGLQGVQEMANDLSWHGRFANGSVYRLVRIEPVAEVRVWHPRTYWCSIDRWLKDILRSLSLTGPNVFDNFYSALYTVLRDLARDPVVVGFKSVVGYRTGLNINVNSDDIPGVVKSIFATVSSWKKQTGGSGVLRLADKALNDFVVCTALSIATEFKKPGECSLTLPHGRTPSEPKWTLVQSNSTLVSVTRTSPSHCPPQPTCNRPSRRTPMQRLSSSMAVIPTAVTLAILHPFTGMSTSISERCSRS